MELWSSASYEPHLLSLPFAFAPAAMLIVIAYALVMRGEPKLRAWMLAHFVALMPYSLTMALSPSLRSPAAALTAFRAAGSFIPLAAAAGAGFQLTMLGKRGPWRVFVWAGVVVASAWAILGLTTDVLVDDVHWLPPGFWYAKAGSLVWASLASTLLISGPTFALMTIAAFREQPGEERRQLRFVLAANYVTYAGLTDVALAYGIGWFPLGWFLSGVGSVLVARALVVEDLLRVRAIDTTAPQLVLHFTVAVLFGWLMLGVLGHVTWWGMGIALSLSYLGVRTTIATVGLINRGARGGEGPLERLLDQLVVRARALTSEPDVARLAIDIVELGLGVKIDVLIAQAEDYGWTDAAGVRLPDEAAPDPLLGAWLGEQRGALWPEHPGIPDDLREPLRGLLAKRGRTLIPATAHDELLALIIVPATHPVRGRSLAFLEQTAVRLGEALVHARMAHRAEQRAALAREVELAAVVQQQLLPKPGPHVYGDLTIVGSWLPATRCAGDFWGVYSLGDKRVLVAIGDVTGHGVASATVTAAAAAACDVAVRRHGSALDLTQLVTMLDAAVRRVGGGQLSMTCFAAILDPDASEVRFVSCGHTSPYVCRAGETSEPAIELHALVGRGNPLGGGSAPAPKVQQKQLRAGDLVVWYTDGVIEAKDPAGEAYGDRRLQRMLRKLDRNQLTAPAVHTVIHAAVAAHRGSRPRGDDETLVVAQWAPS
ncbi:MAG: SpoIIE family protein phosphatase [Deltaproteobacteria bacterium]|nr:SpoIIE family protein phosphatase [Deltaproteobacteria bacterium]